MKCCGLASVLLFACLALATSAQDCWVGTPFTIQGTTIGDTGIFGSNLDSSLYINNAVCSWDFLALPTGRAYQIEVTSFELEAGYDHLTVNNAEVLGTGVVVLCSTSVEATFTTDASVTRRGFTATWTVVATSGPSACVVDATPSPPPSTVESCWLRAQPIELILATGVLNTNAATTLYANDADCTFQFEGVGMQINLTITRLVLESSGADTVTLTNARLGDQLFPDTRTLPVRLVNTQYTFCSGMRVQFNADSSITASGMQATYSAALPPDGNCTVNLNGVIVGPQETFNVADEPVAARLRVLWNTLPGVLFAVALAIRYFTAVGTARVNAEAKRKAVFATSQKSLLRSGRLADDVRQSVAAEVSNDLKASSANSASTAGTDAYSSTYAASSA